MAKEFQIKITGGESQKDGVYVGDVFLAAVYQFDPSEKYTLIKKLSGSKKKYEEYSRNHYRRDAKRLKDSEKIDYLKQGDVIYCECYHGTGKLTVGRVKKETPKRVKAPINEGGTVTINKGVSEYYEGVAIFKEIGGQYRWWRKVTPEIQKRIEQQGIEIPGPREYNL